MVFIPIQDSGAEGWKLVSVTSSSDAYPYAFHNIYGNIIGRAYDIYVMLVIWK
jgi:hypothetical protein